MNRTSSDMNERPEKNEADGFGDKSCNADRPKSPFQKTLENPRLDQILLVMLQNPHFQSATLMRLTELLHVRQQQEQLLEQQQKDNKGGSSVVSSLLGPFAQVNLGPQVEHASTFTPTIFQNVNTNTSDLNNTTNQTPLNSENAMQLLSMLQMITTSSNLTNLDTIEQPSQDTTVNTSNLVTQPDMVSNLQAHSPGAGAVVGNIPETTSTHLAYDSAAQSSHEAGNVELRRDTVFNETRPAREG